MGKRKILIDIIENSLKEKHKAFSQLKSLTEEQKELLNFDEINLDSFGYIIDKKDVLLQQLQEIDEALANAQEEIENYLTSGLEPHQEQISEIRNELTILDNITKELVQLESDCECKVNQFFDVKKTDIQHFKKSKHVATKYAQNMPDTHQEEMSYFMDRKK